MPLMLGNSIGALVGPLSIAVAGDGGFDVGVFDVQEFDA